MKKNALMVLTVLLAAVVVARADGQLEPSKPAVAEKPAKKAKAATPIAPVASAGITEKPVVLTPGAATIVGKNVNVRGKASFKGEVVTKLQSGDSVTVIEQVILSKPKAGEPSNWAKVAFPASAKVWVHNSYLNADKTVKPKKLNVRTGPGENYSIVGTLEQGAAVKEISTKGNWTEIEAPAGSFAYVAAIFIQQAPTAIDAVPPVVVIQPPEPTTTPIGSEPLIAASTTDIGNTNASAEPSPVVSSDPNAAAPPAVIEEVLVPRTVSHEGIVRRSTSIQAPTEYSLYSKENNKLINYLLSPTAVLDISRYYGRHIIVSGQEGLDERWANTPVLTIQKIYVVTD
jgi:uncharacterized protein YgiM (DUF1202 family)